MEIVDTSANPTRPTIDIDIFSDVVCPWCYIGKRRFENGLDQIDEDLGVDFNVRYHAYQLDPDAAPGVATPVAEGYAKKFGGPEKAAEILTHVTTTAAQDGIEFNMDKALRANTSACPPPHLAGRPSRLACRSSRNEGTSHAGLLHRWPAHWQP